VGAMMLHIEWFDAKDDPDDLERFFRERALPFWRAHGFAGKVELYRTAFSFGPAQFCLITRLDRVEELAEWGPRNDTPEGREIMRALQGMQVNLRASLVEAVGG
jgi:hypothetical protein